MIKLIKPDKPKILEDNATEWTKNLLESIKKYGDYKSIPTDEKEKLLKYYRDDNIREPLFNSSYRKCSFCECKPEESSYIQVEHFYPKSLYPEKTFEWNNFLPACGKCNLVKSDHDTKNEEIVNPYIDNPSEFFSFNSLRMIPNQNCVEKDKAEKTIEECGLNENRLFTPRAALLIELHNFENTLAEKIESIVDADSEQKKRRRINKLRESIDIIEELYKPSAKFSFFIKVFLDNSYIYEKAKTILQNP